MPEITIPASEVRTGDVISFGGWPRIVRAVLPGGTGVTIYLDPAGVIYDIPADLQPLTVDRPDPDAEVIEAMARAIGDYYIPGGWNTTHGDVDVDRECSRSAARLALAAYREHTQA